MKKTIFSVLMLIFIVCTIAFSQDNPTPNLLGLGVSIGQRGNGSESISADLTSPYLHFAQNEYFALRIATDLLATEGIPVGGTTYTWQRPSYYAARLGIVMGQLPNDYIRLYRELGGLMVIPTGDVASTIIPGWGLYVEFGVEFIFNQKKQNCLFAEIGDEVTLINATADKLQGAPSMGNGPTVTAGWRYYF